MSDTRTLVRRKNRSLPGLLCDKKDGEVSESTKRTIYVETLHHHSTDHASLKKEFGLVGDVSYVSLPKYPSSSNIKGFAFIEFKEKSSVDHLFSLLKKAKDPVLLSSEMDVDFGSEADSRPSIANIKKYRIMTK